MLTRSLLPNFRELDFWFISVAQIVNILAIMLVSLTSIVQEGSLISHQKEKELEIAKSFDISPTCTPLSRDPQRWRVVVRVGGQVGQFQSHVCQHHFLISNKQAASVEVICFKRLESPSKNKRSPVSSLGIITILEWRRKGENEPLDDFNSIKTRHGYHRPPS